MSQALDECVADWEPTKKDHCKILLSLDFLETLEKQDCLGKPWSTVQPELRKINEKTKTQCLLATNEPLEQLLLELKDALNQSPQKLEVANRFSVQTADLIVRLVGSITGLRRASHRKGQFQNSGITKARAEISTITKARDLIRALRLQEFRTPQEKSALETYLKVCFDRLLRLGLTSIPTSFDIDTLALWSEQVAVMDILQIEHFIKSQKEDLVSKSKEHNYTYLRIPRNEENGSLKYLDLPGGLSKFCH